MLQDVPLYVAAAGLTPLVAVAIVTDLRSLTIPNEIVLGLAGLFLVVGFWGLPWDVTLMRVAHGLVALLLGFVIWSLKGENFGGGDVKMVAALVPYVPGFHLLIVVQLFVVVTVLFVVIHQLFYWLWARWRPTGWRAMDQAFFVPMALPLGLTLIFYLALRIWGPL